MAEIVALVIQIPSNTVYKKATESLNVDIEYEYRGPAQRVYLTAVVTQETWYQEFDEIGSTKKIVYIDLPQSSTLRSYTTRVPSLPLAGCEPKTYGVKVKAEGTFGAVEAGNKSCLYVQAPAGIGFQVGIWGYPDFGTYDFWRCYYWDPGVSGYVGAGDWVYPSEKVAFSNVQTGGAFAVYLWKGYSSGVYYSPYFNAVDGGIYQFDLENNEVRRIA